MKNKEEAKYSDKISHMFSSIHKRYDFFNHVFSLGADYWWRHRLVNAFTLGASNKVLDMAAGTLDVSIAIAKKYPETQIIAGDICEDMLLFGEDKVSNLAQKKRNKKECYLCKKANTFFKKIFLSPKDTTQNSFSACDKSSHTSHKTMDTLDTRCGIDTQIKTQVMDAQEIPFEEAYFDVCTIAFGIRNVENRLKALQEMHRVLVTGGQLCILEFAPVHTPFLGKAYHFYIEKIMPKLVKLFVGEEESYAYLAKSIKEFPLQDDFVQTIKEAGFSFVKYEKLSLGMVTLYIAIKGNNKNSSQKTFFENLSHQQKIEGNLQHQKTPEIKPHEGKKLDDTSKILESKKPSNSISSQITRPKNSKMQNTNIVGEESIPPKNTHKNSKVTALKTEKQTERRASTNKTVASAKSSTTTKPSTTRKKATKPNPV